MALMRGTAYGGRGCDDFKFNFVQLWDVVHAFEMQ